MGKLTRIEMETVITFNEKEGVAEINVMNTRLRRKLEQLSVERADEVVKHSDCSYQIPKKWIKINAPRIMSDEQKQAASERFRAVRDSVSKS